MMWRFKIYVAMPTGYRVMPRVNSAQRVNSIFNSRTAPPLSPSAERLGLTNYTNDGNPKNHLFAVEFDVFQDQDLNGVYSFCDGPKLSNGLYMGVVAVCSAASLVFVSLKASYVFMNSRYGGYWGYSGGYVRVMVASMFVSSLGLAIGGCRSWAGGCRRVDDDDSDGR
ncbi:hypothetical protein CASFOL_005490 [Castilleja foliolosa]|uniref:Legume lectin domain-containing protein n=1 Tax=Castilleja foliolosa TaxID=1961234 RepID=A0ABD3E5K0_9LAMI